MDKVICLILSCIIAYGSVNAMGRGPLHKAAKLGDLDQVVDLLGYYNCSNVNMQDTWNRTPLHLAAKHGHIRVVRLLLEYGAAVNVQDKDEGRMPLHLAARYGKLEIVRLLLEHDADFNKQDMHGRTPGQCAAINGHHAIVELLSNWQAKHDIRTLVMASHDRVGAESPVNLFSQYLFQEIFEQVRLSIFEEYQHGAEDFRETQNHCVVS